MNKTEKQRYNELVVMPRVQIVDVDQGRVRAWSEECSHCVFHVVLTEMGRLIFDLSIAGLWSLISEALNNWKTHDISSTFAMYCENLCLSGVSRTTILRISKINLLFILIFSIGFCTLVYYVFSHLCTQWLFLHHFNKIYLLDGSLSSLLIVMFAASWN